MYTRASAMSTGSNSTYSNNNANNSNTAANNAANNNAATRSCDTNTIADLSSDLNGGGGASAGGCCCGCWRLGCCACQNNNNNHCHCACWNAFWDRAYASCLLPTSEKVLASAIWRVVLVIGNILLLFGHPLQMLWLPKGADPVMDVIYCVVLVVFLIDMVFRATAVAGYFGISVTRIYHRSPHHYSRQRDDHNNELRLNASNHGTGNSGVGGSGNNQSGNSNNNNSNSTKNKSGKKNHTSSSGSGGDATNPSCLLDVLESLRCISIGSFLFWCDLLSTLTLLYDISYTNPSNYSFVEVDLDLEINYLKALDDGSINQASPWEFSMALMVTILKTARIVRFVRSQAVSSLISRVNWYWPLQKGSQILAALDCCSAAQDYFFSPEDDSSNHGDNAAPATTL